MELGFIEYLVAKERTRAVKTKEKLTLIACLAVTLLLCLLFWIILFDSPLYAAAFSAFFGWICFLVWKKLRRQFYEEFEYCIVSDEMTISRIRGQEQRKQLCVIPLREVTRLAPLSDCLSQAEQADRVLDASSGTDAPADQGNEGNAAVRYCLFYNSDRGTQAVVFHATQEILRAMRPYCLRAMKH